jgi:hypothetical protein
MLYYSLRHSYNVSLQKAKEPNRFKIIDVEQYSPSQACITIKTSDGKFYSVLSLSVQHFCFLFSTFVLTGVLWRTSPWFDKPKTVSFYTFLSPIFFGVYCSHAIVHYISLNIANKSVEEDTYTYFIRNNHSYWGWAVMYVHIAIVPGNTCSSSNELEVIRMVCFFR